MKRLIVAACLAVGVHVALFSLQPQWTPPALLMPQSRSVTISLVAAPPAPPPKVLPRPVEKPKPKPTPKPKPVKAPEPVVETMPEPEPEPLPETAVALPEQRQSIADPVQEETPVSQTPGPQEGAIIQSSVPRYDINPAPVYPPRARRRGYEGVVKLEVMVTRQGRAGQVSVVQSSGYPILDRRAVEAVQKWLFTPALRGKEAVEMRVAIPIVFKLQ